MDRQNNETISHQKNQSIKQKLFRNQPVLCPWISSQPYQSSLFNKNRNIKQNPSSLTTCFSNNPWLNRNKQMDVPNKSSQQLCSQFFYFLRLMDLFPKTHPATLHAVLTLSKNDFFCAINKLSYAKRCKVTYYRRTVLRETACNSNKRQNITRKDIREKLFKKNAGTVTNEKNKRSSKQCSRNCNFWTM